MANLNDPKRNISLNQPMSAAAASAILTAETRAFGNAAAKADLQRATAAFQARAAQIRHAASVENTEHPSK